MAFPNILVKYICADEKINIKKRPIHIKYRSLSAFYWLKVRASL